MAVVQQIYSVFNLLLLLVFAQKHDAFEFAFNGFNGREEELDFEGATIIKPSGLLRLTNRSNLVTGHAFYSKPIELLSHNSTSNKVYVSSFSTCFVFGIIPQRTKPGGFGLAFTISPSKEFPGAEAGHYLGIFNSSSIGKPTNHIFFVEFDTVNGFNDSMDSEGNHVGVNTHGMNSIVSEPAAYYRDGSQSEKEDINLESEDAEPICAWIEYDGMKKHLNVTIFPLSLEKKPDKPLISHSINLDDVLTMEEMYFGFTASTGETKSSSHYILGWSFSVAKRAQELNFTLIPKLPNQDGSSSSSKTATKALIGGLFALLITLLAVMCFLVFYKRMAPTFESLEDWELDCPHRFRFKDLYVATKGFKDSEIIGVGGFGAVYKGVLPSTGCQIAVKKITRNSLQGVRDFSAEVESLGKLRHKNLVNLQGWCKKKNNLIIVYDYIPNGSLDSLIFNPRDESVLDWEQRLSILKGIAEGLHYLHEEYRQVVIHRDVKSSNVLIDTDMTARLSDFGLARLHDHQGEISHTTGVVGTVGYIAPELARTGKASTATDLFAYGVLLLEVACGRRPVGSRNFILVDWVTECYQMNRILDVVDPKLGKEFVAEEMELVLKLGLLCSCHRAEARPSMRQVVRYLNGDDLLPVFDGLVPDIETQRDYRMNARYMEVVPNGTNISYNSPSLGASSSFSSFNTGR